MCECEGYDQYKEFPDPCLAFLMWHEEPSKCVACNKSAEYLIPSLCEKHFGWWLHNQRQFERKFYHD